ncbi:MAG: DUF2029 domain-containing protein [Chloroflexi bacterium]|nr:DUF2029 domain-containing protein [Chloroflexota bacterium]
MFKDLDIFLAAAQAILRGVDPYSIPNLEVFYPLPFYLLFIPLAGLSAPVAHVLWTAIQAVVFIVVFRKRVIFTALSMPILLTFLLGQVDILMAGLFVALRSGIGGGIALAIMMLKPQLVIILAPWMVWRWWKRDRRQMWWFAAILTGIVIASFLVQPDWLVRFFARSGERTRAALSSSLWGLLAFLPSSIWLPVAALLVAIIVIWAWRKNDFDIVAAVGLLTSPFIFSYNLLPLIILIHQPRFLIGFTILSWVAFAISAWVSNDRAAAFLTIGTLAVLVTQTPARKIGARP